MARYLQGGALALMLVGCATVPRAPELPLGREVVLSGVTFYVEHEAIDEAVATEVVAALEAAVPRVLRWGAFTSPMHVRIHPSHDALEAAVHRFNYPWLRAWARYDTIDLQSPRTWGILGGTFPALVELVTHELTHCLMYQRSGDRQTWMRKGIPLWFREGMASVTANQGYRRPAEQELWRYLRSNPGKDPIAQANRLYQGEADIVYGAAHRAFEFLVGRYGDEAVRKVLERMEGGERFPEAFHHGIGLAEPVFVAEFLRYVRLEGWRGDERSASRPLIRSRQRGGIAAPRLPDGREMPAER